MTSVLVALGCKSSILAFFDRPGPAKRGLFFRPPLPSKILSMSRGPIGPPKTALALGFKSSTLAFFDRPNCQEMWPSRVCMSHGPLGSLKVYLVAKVQFWHFLTDPDLRKEAFYFRPPLPSQIVSMSGGPEGPQKLHSVTKVQFCVFRQVRTCKKRRFFQSWSA